jgi:hypothetical protein
MRNQAARRLEIADDGVVPAARNRVDGPRRARRDETRRRRQLIRRRRLDLLQDGALALTLALFVLVESAGLGVVALLCVCALMLVAATAAGGRFARRRRSAPRRPRAR